VIHGIEKSTVLTRFSLYSHTCRQQNILHLKTIRESKKPMKTIFAAFIFAGFNSVTDKQNKCNNRKFSLIDTFSNVHISSLECSVSSFRRQLIPTTRFLLSSNLSNPILNATDAIRVIFSASPRTTFYKLDGDRPKVRECEILITFTEVRYSALIPVGCLQSR